jgi:hypothetical protein
MASELRGAPLGGPPAIMTVEVPWIGIPSLGGLRFSFQSGISFWPGPLGLFKLWTSLYLRGNDKICRVADAVV